MADGYSNDYGNPNAYGAAQVPGTNSGMLTPDYNAIQDAVRRQQSPYVTMPAHGFLQDRFPGAAGILDNVFLTAANTPGPRGPEGAGGGISRTFQGLMGARQMQMQHGLQQALLPMDIAQRQMAYQQGMLNMQKTQAETTEMRQRGNYYDQQADTNRQYRGWLENNKPMYGTQDKIDDEGRPWRTNLRTGQMEHVGTEPLPEGYNPSFNKANTRARMGALPGGLEGQILFGQNGVTDPSSMTPDQWRDLGVDYTTMEARKAGQKAGAVDQTRTPDKFLDEQRSALGKPPTDAEQRDLDQKQKRLAILGKDGYEQIYGPGSSKFDYKTLDQRKAEFQEKQRRFASYTQSNSWRKGKPFNADDWPVANSQPATNVPGTTPQGAAPRSLSDALDSIFPRQ